MQKKELATISEYVNKSDSGRQTERILQSYNWCDTPGIEYDQKRRKYLKILVKEETAKDIV